MSELTAETLYEKLNELGEDWATKDADWRALDDSTKNVLAECKRKRNEPSDAAKETAARCEDAFLDHVKALGKARRAANIARVNYENYQIYIELIRTRQANRRAEMQLR